jgi:sulfur carrier protein
MFKVSVNNQLLDIENDTTLSELIVIAGFADQMVAIAIDGEFVPKHQYQHTVLTSNTNIDIVKPIGGG